MRVVIAGGGRVGGALAQRLVAGKHTVTVIERSQAVCDRVFEDVGAATVCGEATDPATLQSAGIATADIAAGVLARDADNLAFAMLVRSLSKARVMVRMLDTSYRQAYRLAGVRDVVAEADVVVGKLETAIEFPQVVGAMPLATSDAIIIELPIVARAVVAGRTVAQVRALGEFPPDCLFIGLADPEGNIEVPHGETVLSAGLTAVLVARRRVLGQLIACLTHEPGGAEPSPAIAPALRRIDFLAPLSDDELGELLRDLTLLRRSSGDIVFKKGDQGETFYIVLSGEVRISGDDGRQLATVHPGGFFGEIAVLTGEPRTAHATAASETEMAAIGKDAFRRVIMANPTIALEMSRLLGRRLASGARAEPAKKKGFFGR